MLESLQFLLGWYMAVSIYIKGLFLGWPYNKIPTILTSISGPLILGKFDTLGGAATH